MDYSNLVRLKGDDLKNAVKRAPSMDDAIFLIYFHTQQAWGVYQIIEMGRLAGYRWTLTVARKTINSLVSAKKLVKADYKKLTEDKWRAAAGYKPRH